MKYTKVGNYYVRRPQATRVGAERANLQDLLEIVGGVFVLGVMFLVMPWVVWLWLS